MWALLAAVPAGADAQDSQVRRTVVAPAETLHVETRGHGYPVVIVPGIWSSAFAFRKVIPDLVTSMVLRLATLQPLVIRGLVSLEGSADEVSATPGLRRGLAIGSWIFRLIPSQRLIRHQVKKNLENVSGDRTWITPEVVAEYTASFSVSISATFAAYRAMAASTESFLIRPRLRSLTFPVDLMLGMADHYGGPSADEIAPLQEHLTGLMITRVPRAGHLLQEERPDQVVAAIFRMHRMIAAPRD
jgi:pimeloyl-ACP methyl ester carboxylesterase